MFLHSLNTDLPFLRYRCPPGFLLGNACQSRQMLFLLVPHENKGLRVVYLGVLVVGQEGASEFVAIHQEILPCQMQVHCRLSFSPQGQKSFPCFFRAEPECYCLLLAHFGVGVEEEDCMFVDEEGRFQEFRVIFSGVRESCIPDTLPESSSVRTCIIHHLPMLLDAMQYLSFRASASPTEKNTPCPLFVIVISLPSIDPYPLLLPGVYCLCDVTLALGSQYNRRERMKDKTRDEREQFEEKVGVGFREGPRSIMGFLTNFKTKSYRDREHDNQERMAVLCFFQSEDGELVKCLLPYKPYFYVGFAEGAEKEVQAYLESKLEKVESIEVQEKVDLEEVNHLSGRMKEYLKVNFRTVRDLTNAKNPLKGLLDKRRKRNHDDDNPFYGTSKIRDVRDVTDLITGIRQFDVPFHSRVCIDSGLRAGKWFQVQIQDKMITSFKPATGQRGVPQLKILSFDIETAKDPLKFPDAEKDEIMMVSLMYEGEAFLVINCGFCGQPVEQFDYEPKPEFACHVTVFNEPSEKDLLLRFASFIQGYNPHIITTYNGDKFDYPYIQRRMELNFLRFTAEMGVSEQSGEFYGSHIAHLDCFCWVERDAFLPQGSRGLKAVTKAKLNYDPIEVDPQDMVWLAKNHTQRLAEYSISDAVATYFLYMKHIHGFILALATIIPMFPDQVLRKGSGTLCENLLMAEAYTRRIIFPNKKMEDVDKYHKGNLLDSETYTGGKVECLRTGVYRADFPTDFNLNPSAFQDLIESVQEILRFAISVEMPQESLQNAINRDQIRQEVVKRLQTLRDVRSPHKFETFPLIYHIDVAAMYPNIILTNRLQPVSIVDDQICSGCLFNAPENKCKRELQWEWRGTVFPLNEGEHMQIKEKISSRFQGEAVELEKAVKAEVKAYSQRIYKKTHIELTETRADIVCMRENSFYVDTVRAFRDRRYQYKHLAKSAENKYKALSKTKDLLGTREQEGLMILYESMQLAHKIILNSFYGYVMRKGARWYSMEMAAMVTYLGSNIISDSKHFIEGRIGKPLELDTDGIWMLLPQGFPEEVKLSFRSGKSLKVSYPCHILNHLIYDKYANDQYQWLESAKDWRYGRRKEMTIFFQIDGPYKAMMIPAAKEKQKTTQLDIQEHNTQMLKKRYVVFNFNNKIKEFKGFQMKRRGELRITKVFQEEIFPQYLMGTSLTECYQHCAAVAKKYLAIINRNGQAMDTQEILDYLQESRVLSRDLNDYGVSKGVALSSARRLAEFLGPEVVKGKGGLCCYFVISRYPQDRPVAERAIPTQIFDADTEVQREFLFKWTRDDALLAGEVDIRKILDWNYYFERLSTQIQKMVCIPAVLQGIPNPVPEIQLPEWLQKKTFDMKHHRQQKLTNFLNLNLKPTPQRSELSARKKDRDMLSAEKQPKGLLSSNSTSRQNPEPNALHRTNKFSMMRNFKSWLGEQKSLWRERKLDANPEGFRGGELKAILQVIPEKTGGNFNVWYWSGGRIQQLLLTVKRRYYCSGRGTKKAPREQGEAIQIVVEEEVFRKQQDYFDAFLGQKFYETKMPLLTSLIMKKGNIWRTTKQAMTYKEEEVQEIFGEYLSEVERSPIPTVFLFHQKVLPGRTFWALVIPKYHEYFFIFVDKSKGAQNDELLMIARKTLKNIEGTTGSERISIQNHSEDREAATAINKRLEALVNQVKQKFMVVLCAEDVEKVRELGVKFLQEEGPVLLLGELPIESPEILDWKRKALKAVLQSSAVGEEVQSLIMWARYSQIPLCNLDKSSQLLNLVTNIQLGRLLHAGDQITWWNDFNSNLTTTYESLAFTGKITTPGIYSNYCIEVAMENLAVNTIAIAEDLGLEDRETAGLVKKGNANNGNAKWETLDEMTQVRKPFEYVRKVVKLWVREFEEKESYYANELLRHFHKWISSQSGALYDPLLTRLVNELMKKVFHLLSKRLEQLGLHLVFANFSKLLVATSKHTPNEARSCVQYALRKCVQDNQKLFKYIGLTPCEDIYKALAFRDQFNFMSILDNGKFYYKLQMVQLMTAQNAKYFQLLLVHFVEKMARLQDELIEEFGENRMQLFLDFDKLLHERVIRYLQEEFVDMLVNVLRKLQNQWEVAREMRKNQPITDNESDQNPEINSEEEEEEENDSFIDDSDQSIRPRRNKQEQEQVQKMEIEWSDTNQLDIFVQNLFAFLSTQQSLRDTLFTIRKASIMELKLEPSLDYGVINPIYPKFQLPCSNCYLVNEQPGQCEHCFRELDCTKELERTVWKMMHEQGRDLYCDRCNRIKQDYLRKCGCGGKWVLKEFPLKWVQYSKRADSAWSFVNQVFEFMGIA